MKFISSVNANETHTLGKFISKPPRKFTREDEIELHKDKKVMNILFNDFKNIFDNVIMCIISGEVCYTLQILCEGTEQNKEKQDATPNIKL